MRKTIILLYLLANLTLYSQSPSELLEGAYKNNSLDSLKQFYLNWNEEIPPVSNEELQSLNDTIRNVYEIFKLLYKPFDIRSLGASDRGDIYKNVDFLLTQNDIKYAFVQKIVTEEDIDSIVVDYINKKIKDEKKKSDYLKRVNGKLSEYAMKLCRPIDLEAKMEYLFEESITNFRPQISFPDKKILFLTSKYEAILNDFLGNEHYPQGSNGVMSTASPKNESKKKKAFLENFIKIFYGHWGGYWQLLSYPEVNVIIFDKNMQYAKVYFRIVYEGGESYLKNNNGKWEIFLSELKWIE